MIQIYCAFKWHFSLILFLCLQLSRFAHSQDLVAGVSISDGKNKVNQQATYRFTLIPSELSFDTGTVIQTFIPSSVSLVLGSSNSVNICRRYIKLTDSTQSLSSCIYNSDLKMVLFTISSNINFDVAFEYELGYILNPGRSSLVTNFQIAINDKNGNNLYDTTLSSTAVQIYPGDIFDQSLTDSSQKVSDLGTFTFKFQITNQIPGDGQFQVTFPNGEIQVPTGITNSDTRVKIYDQDWEVGSILATTNSIYFQGALKNSALTPVAGKYILIEIQKIVNPKSLKQTSSFSISTLDSQYFTIDQTSSLLTVQPTIPGDIQIFGVGPYSSQAVGATTDINFNIQLPQAYDNGGYLLITFPPEVILTSLTCYPYIGFVTQTSNCAFQSSNPQQIVRLSNQVSSTRLYFLISSAQNPNSTRPTSTFTIQAYDASNFLMSQVLSGVTYTSTPASLRAGRAVRSQTQVAAQSTLTISLTLNNQLFNGDHILLKIPFEQMLISTDTPFSLVASTGSTNTSPIFTLDSSTNSSYFVASLVSPCNSGCSASSIITLTVTGVRNPGFIQATYTRSIEIYTVTSDQQFMRDRRISATFTTPLLTQGPISIISISRQQFIVNNPTQLNFQFSLSTQVPPNGLIRLFVPPNSFYNPLSGSVACIEQITQASLSCSSFLNSDSTQGISFIQITSRCSGGCSSSDSFNIQISNLRNRGSVKPITTQFQIGTYTVEQFAIDYGNTSIASGMSLTPDSFSSLSVIFPLSSIITGAQSTLQLGIISKSGITQTLGQLLITLPQELQIFSSSQTCTASALQNTVSLTCLIIYSSNQIKVTNQNSNSFAQQLITVTLLNGVINPSTTKQTNPFIFESSLFDSATQAYYSVEYDSSTLTYKADTPNQLINATIQRSNVELNQATDVLIQFTSFNPIPKGSSIFIAIPSDQVVLKDGNQISLSKSSTGENLQIKSFQNQQNTPLQLAWIEFAEYCSGSGQSSCSAGTQISIKVSGVYNPSSMRLPSISFQILIQQEGVYYSDQTTSNLFISPFLTAGQFKSVQLSQNNNAVGALIELDITLKINNGISSSKEGSLTTQLPENLYYIDSQVLAECFVDQVKVDCQISFVYSAFGKVLTQLIIPMNCNQGCQSDQTKLIAIKNLRNRYSRSSFSGVFQIQSSDNDSLVYDSSAIQFEQTFLPKNLIESPTLIVNSAIKSNLVVFAPTDVTIAFQNSIPFARSQIVQISLPSDGFADLQSSLPSLTCSSILPVSTQISCSIQIDNSDSSNFLISFTEFCTSQSSQICSASTIQSIRISGLSNRYNTKASIKQVKVSILTTDLQLYETTSPSSNVLFNQNLVPQSSLISQDIALTNNKVGEKTDFTLKFSLYNQMLATDTIEIQFSSGLLYTDTQSECQISTQSASQISQACALTNDQSQLLQQISIQLLEDSISSDSQIILTIYNAQNYLKDKAWISTLQLIAKSMDGSLISTGTLSLNQDILAPNIFSYLYASRSNNQLSEQTDISITYQTSIVIDYNSKIGLQIPTSQFAASTSLECLFDGTQMTLTEQNSDQAYQRLQISNICSQSQCNSNQNYTITLKGFSNPSQVQAIQNSILLEIISQGSLSIIQVNTQHLEAQPPLQMGSLENFKITQNSSMIVGNPTNYYFEFEFPSSISQANQIMLQIPTSTLTNPSSGTLNCLNVAKNVKLTCSATSDSINFITLITLSKYCQESDCSQITLQSIKVSNVLNINYLRKRSTQNIFQIKTVSQQGFVLSSADYAESNLPEFEVNTIDSLTVKRSSAKAGDQNVDLTLSFTTNISIQDGSLLVYTLPLEQQSLRDRFSLTCTSGAQTFSCIVISSNDSLVSFRVKEWCSGNCAKGTVMSLVIQRTINPSTIQSVFETSYALRVATALGDLSQEVSSGVQISPSLESIKFTNIQVFRDNNYVGFQSFLTFRIPIQQYISIDTDLEILLPSDLALYRIDNAYTCSVFISGWNDQYTCEYKSSTNAAVSGLNMLGSVKIMKVCQSLYPCYIGNDLQVRFTILNSLITYQQAVALNLTFWQRSVQIGYGQSGNDLLPLIPNNITSSILETTCIYTGQSCNVEMQVNTSNPLRSNLNSSSYLIVQAPAQIVLYPNQLCSALLLDVKITCKILNSSFIQVSHSFDTKSSLQFIYRITINGIRAPPSTEPTDTFIIATSQKIGQSFYQVDTLKEALKFTIAQPNNFTQVKVTRSNTNYNQKVNLIVRFTPFNSMPINSQLRLKIPSSQANLKGEQIDCTITYLVQTYAAPTCLHSNNESVFIISNLCNKINGCAQNQEVTFILSSSSLFNPSYILESYDTDLDSIKMQSMYVSSADSREYLIDNSQSGIFITPTLVPQNLLVQNFSVTSFYTSEYVTISMTLSFQNDSISFSQDYLRLTFYDYTFNKDVFKDIHIEVDSQSTTITSLKSNPLNDSLQQITFPCQESICKGKTMIQIQLANLKNPYFQVKASLIPSYIYRIRALEMINPDGQLISEGYFDMSTHLKNLLISPLQKTQLIQSDENFSAISNISLKFDLFNRPFIPADALILIQLGTNFSYSQRSFNCIDLISSNELKCQFFTTNRTILIKDYFAQEQRVFGKQTVTIKIQGIVMPPTKSSQNLSVQIISGYRQFANDITSFKLESLATISLGCEGSCQTCQAQDTSICLSCGIPSLRPILQGDQCVSECPNGFYEQSLMCFKCGQDCAQCTTPEVCEQCQSPGFALMDGVCVKDQSGNECPSGTIRNSQGFCVQQECHSITLQNGTKENEQCEICGVQADYCYYCGEREFSMNGICVSACPKGYFSNQFNQCKRCSSQCESCEKQADYCTSCRKDAFKNSKLDLSTHKCVDQCSDSSVQSAKDPDICEQCSSNCFTCSGSASNCTSCYFDKSSLADLFLHNNQCLEECPIGLFANYDNHLCEDQTYQFLSFPPLYLASSVTLSGMTLVASKLLSGRADLTSEIGLSILTQIEFLNRVFLFVNLWSSTKTFSFCVTCLSLVGNSFLSIYFGTLVMDPILNQVPQAAASSNSKVFKFILVLSQISGINTLRILTSNFFGLQLFSNKFSEIVYYVKQLETVSLISSVLNFFQLCTGISCIFDFGFSQDSMGLGVNSIVLNAVMIGVQVYKFVKVFKILSQYEKVSQI